MLTSSQQKISFDQFLFAQFNIKNLKKSVASTDFMVTPLKSKKKTTQVISKKTDQINKPKKRASLSEVIADLPDKQKSSLAENIAKQHEVEWFHLFRDLQDKINDEFAHHQQQAELTKIKEEVHEFWEQLDEHIEHIGLKIETLFQAFPNVSRIALLYLLAFIISVPLVFFSAQSSTPTTLIDQPIVSQPVHFTQAMKSEYIARYGAKILASGQKTVRVTKRTNSPQIAGAYEDNSLEIINEKLKLKIFRYYQRLTDAKDNFWYFINQQFK